MSNEVPPIDVAVEEAEADGDATDAPMPFLTERPVLEDGTLITPTMLTTTISYISNTVATHIVQDAEGKTVHAYEEPIKPRDPIHYGGTQSQGCMLPLQHTVPRRTTCVCVCVLFECGGPVQARVS